MAHQIPTLRSIISIVTRPYRWYALGFITLIAITASEWAIYSYLIKWLLDEMQNTLTHKTPLTLLPAILLLVDSGSVVIFYRIWDWLKLKVRPNIEAYIGDFLIKHLMLHAHSFYQEHFVGALVSKVNDIAIGIPYLIEMIFEEFLYIAITVLTSLGMLWITVPSIAAITTVWVTAFILLSFKASHAITHASEVVAEKRSIVTGQITDCASNMVAIRLFNGKKHEQGLLHALWSDWKEATRTRDWALLKVYILHSISWFIREIATFYIIITEFNQGTLTIGDTALALTLSSTLAMSLWGLTKNITKAMKLIGEISQGINTLMTPQTMLDAPHATPLTVSAGTIHFENVSFAHTPGSPIFNNLSLTIAPGQKIGLVGYSGSGKTTLVNLILRLFDAQDGNIAIDGQDITQVTQKSLRTAIAFIPQDPALFHRSLYDNINYGNFNASKEEVHRATLQAHADEFIAALPEKYNTLVGDRGIKLSGGQRQRIAIARAFLKHAPILIMDEATSALDSATEQYIQESLETLSAKRTTIVIAHRLATLLTMDRIIVLDKGNIIEDGSHEALLAKRGKYYELWQAQSNGFIPDKPSH